MGCTGYPIASHKGTVISLRMNVKQDKTRALYLKKVRSPIYIKKIKRSVELLNIYNKVVRGGKLPHSDILESAIYYNEVITTDRRNNDNE